MPTVVHVDMMMAMERGSDLETPGQLIQGLEAVMMGARGLMGHQYVGSLLGQCSVNVRENRAAMPQWEPVPPAT